MSFLSKNNTFIYSWLQHTYEFEFYFDAKHYLNLVDSHPFKVKVHPSDNNVNN